MSGMPANVAELAAQAQEMSRLLRAVAHPARLLVLCSLVDTELGVSEIEQATSVKQPTLSRELAKLREAGLIRSRRKSKAVFYTIADPRAAGLVGALCSIGKENAPTQADDSRLKESRTAAALFARAGHPPPVGQ